MNDFKQLAKALKHSTHSFMKVFDSHRSTWILLLSYYFIACFQIL